MRQHFGLRRLFRLGRFRELVRRPSASAAVRHILLGLVLGQALEQLFPSPRLFAQILCLVLQLSPGRRPARRKTGSAASPKNTLLKSCASRGGRGLPEHELTARSTLHALHLAQQNQANGSRCRLACVPPQADRSNPSTSTSRTSPSRNDGLRRSIRLASPALRKISAPRQPRRPPGLPLLQLLPVASPPGGLNQDRCSRSPSPI